MAAAAGLAGVRGGAIATPGAGAGAAAGSWALVAAREPEQLDMIELHMVADVAGDLPVGSDAPPGGVEDAGDGMPAESGESADLGVDVRETT